MEIWSLFPCITLKHEIRNMWKTNSSNCINKTICLWESHCNDTSNHYFKSHLSILEIYTLNKFLVIFTLRSPSTPKCICDSYCYSIDFLYIYIFFSLGLIFLFVFYFTFDTQTHAHPCHPLPAKLQLEACLFALEYTRINGQMSSLKALLKR